LPYPMSRTFWENLALCRWHFRNKRVRLSAVILQPRMPYWRMRLIGFLLSPWNFLAMNEAFVHFMLRPRSAPTIFRHMLWRTRNFLVWEFSPGGAIYTLLWRLAHPKAFRRPVLVLLARLSGLVATGWKALAPLRPAVSEISAHRPQGISVVVPSR